MERDGDEQEEEEDQQRRRNVVVEDAEIFPPGFGTTVSNNNNNGPAPVLLENFNEDIAMEVVRNIETAALEDEVEWQRLQIALKRLIARKHRLAQDDQVVDHH